MNGKYHKEQSIVNRPPEMHRSFELSNKRPNLMTERLHGKILVKDKSLGFSHFRIDPQTQI